MYYPSISNALVGFCALVFLSADLKNNFLNHLVPNFNSIYFTILSLLLLGSFFIIFFRTKYHFRFLMFVFLSFCFSLPPLFLSGYNSDLIVYFFVLSLGIRLFLNKMSLLYFSVFCGFVSSLYAFYMFFYIGHSFPRPPTWFGSSSVFPLVFLILLSVIRFNFSLRNIAVLSILNIFPRNGKFLLCVVMALLLKARIQYVLFVIPFIFVLGVLRDFDLLIESAFSRFHFDEYHSFLQFLYFDNFFLFIFYIIFFIFSLFLMLYLKSNLSSLIGFFSFFSLLLFENVMFSDLFITSVIILYMSHLGSFFISKFVDPYYHESI